METDNQVVMYILMRTDMASMNPGKAVAQGAHAANQCVLPLRGPWDGMETPDSALLYEEWSAQTSGGFGTTITLGVNYEQMERHVMAAQEAGLHAGLVFDPTYPLLDGSFLHLLPIYTCGFVLARKSAAAPILSELSLMA